MKTSEQKTKKRIKVSVRRASELFNVDRHTLSRKLAAAYPGGRPRNQYTLAEVYRALCPVSQEARVRQLKAQADLLEMKVREKQAMLVDPEEYREFVLDFARAAEETMVDFPPDIKRTLLAHVKALKRRCLADIDKHLSERR